MNTATTLSFREGLFPFPDQGQVKVFDGLGQKIIDAVGASIAHRSHQTYPYRWRGQDTLSWGSADEWIVLKLLVGLIENPKTLAYPEQYPVIQSIQSIRLANEIQAKYMLRLSDDVQAYLYQHPGVADVISDAHTYLMEAFGQSFHVRMQIVKDPEIDDFEQLIAYIITNASVSDALVKLDQFDRDWYLNQLERLDGAFSFNLDFV